VLRLLLDEHLSPTVAEQIVALRPEIAVISLRNWESGVYLEAPDEVILAAAREEALTLVTYDQRTIPPLLKGWGEQGISHAGVVIVDERTIASHDFGGLIRALCQLWDAQGQWDWTDRVVYLTR
jgi:uncharacterized protein DUF5615